MDELKLEMTKGLTAKTDEEKAAFKTLMADSAVA